MTLLHEAVEQKKFDVRMVERNVSRGIVQATDVQKHVVGLQDDADAAQYISIESLKDDSAKGKKSPEVGNA